MEIKFTISETKLTHETLREYDLDNKLLKAKFCFIAPDFPRSIFVHESAFSEYDLSDTCVVENHVAYSFSGVNMDEDCEEPKIDSATYRASNDVPEILIYVGVDPA
jgi:hypothetical protein